MTKREYLLSRGIYSTNPEIVSDDIADDDFIGYVDAFVEGVKKANEEIKCECCGKKVLKWKTVGLCLPIDVSDGEEHYIGTKDMVICENCGNVIMKAYYAEAINHGSSGVRGVDYG